MKEFKHYFIYVGNAYPHKNLGRLIEAMVLINKEVKEDIGLAIVSSRNVFVQRLEALIKKLNAENYIKLLGFVPDEKLAGLYKGSTAFVFPSISEGFGLPGLEAMASGSLVLASDIPVFREIYQDNAIYFNPFDVGSIKDTMKSALEAGAGEREKRTSKGRQFAKRYSWLKMARQTLDVYNNAL